MLNVRMVDIMYNGLVQGEQKRQILIKIKKQVYRAAKTYGLNRSEAKHLWIHAYETYNQMYRESFGELRALKKRLKRGETDENAEKVAVTVYKVAEKALIVDKLMQKATNRVINNMERRDKFDTLRESLSKIEGYTPFYLCSWHSDSAPDHKGHQGKMYYDADYRNKLKKDPELLEQVRVYIRNRGLKKLQWVLNEPVYMTTRPNCRHFFTPLPCPEVLSSGIPALLKRHGLRFYAPEVVEEESQSLKERAKKASRAYVSRYQIHKVMWKVMPNEELALDMKRDRKLIKKWNKIAARQ